ncbi:AMP-binding protein [Chryseolinea sp. T2]|uniref:AMP-binding protein n=1 Tax=Chryseolinea sp. T2 TaxID=3129255 RepID=UPI003077EE63
MKDFPWYKQYPEGVEKEPKLYEYTSLVDLINKSCEKFSERAAFENMGVTLSYKELDKLANDFAAYLQNDLGLKKGERIAIQMPNLLQFPVVFIGALRAGLTVVNTNPLYTAREMDHQFRDAEISALVIVANFAHNLEKVPYLASIKHVIVTELGDMLGTLKGAMVNFVVKRIKKMVPAYDLPNAVRFKDAMRKGANSTFKPVALDLTDIAILQYTGGTTGIAKGAQLSHGNLVAHNAIVVQWFKPYLTASNDNIVLTALPLYHIFALTVNGMLMFTTGVRNLLITNARDIPGLVKELKSHKVTIITAVNTLFNGLMNNPHFKEVDFAPLQGAVGGGMAVQDAVAKRWEQVTGKALVEGYGLSETSPAICCNPLNGKHKIGTIGLPLPATELGIFDEKGNQLAQGENGEICVRGPQVMSGYWRSDNKNVFFEGGWFRTGDIGFMDADGFFKIIDRIKDMIKVSGFNVFPNEIENVVSSHPKVLEVAAIGVPDEKSGEAIKVFVVKRDQSLTESDVMNFCRENLTKYKVPRHLEFRKELPKSNVGKILRRPLREEEMKK